VQTVYFFVSELCEYIDHVPKKRPIAFNV